MHHPSLVSPAKLLCQDLRQLYPSSCLSICPQLFLFAQNRGLNWLYLRETAESSFSLGLYAARAVSRASLTASSNQPHRVCLLPVTSSLLPFPHSPSSYKSNAQSHVYSSVWVEIHRYGLCFPSSLSSSCLSGFPFAPPNVMLPWLERAVTPTRFKLWRIRHAAWCKFFIGGWVDAPQMLHERLVVAIGLGVDAGDGMGL
jgi:hypothetical protein